VKKLATTTSVETAADAIARLLDSFERYAGWVSHSGYKPAADNGLRAHITALRGAVGAEGETAGWMQVIDGDIRRLPGGEIPKMLRKTLAEIAVALESQHHEREVERRS